MVLWKNLTEEEVGNRKRAACSKSFVKQHVAVSSAACLTRFDLSVDFEEKMTTINVYGLQGHCLRKKCPLCHKVKQ